MFRPSRSSSRSSHSLSLALALGLAATASPVRLAAQDAAPEPDPAAPSIPAEPAPAVPASPAQAAPAAEASAPLTAIAPAEMVGPLILRDTPLDQILELVERWTGRVLLRPASLPPGAYAITLDKQLPKSEALRAIETLLAMNGVGLAPLGDRFIKVAPLNLIRTETPELMDGSLLGLPPSGRIVTKIFNLDFLRVAEFVPQISSLLNPALGSAPVVFEKNNSVLVTDSVATLQRIERLVATLDRPAAANFAVKSYPISNAKASDLVNKLRTLLSGPLAAQIGTATTYQPDDRTNKVILIADPREHAFFDQLIAKLDDEASPNTRSEVIFLKHANATEVATLLSQLISGQNTAATREGGGASRPTTAAGRRAAAAAGGGEGAPAAPTPAAAVNAAVNAMASEEFSSYLTIVADERSNAIVVAGTPNDIKLVTSLVDRIDVLLAQVRIEVVIAEVTLSDESNSGINSLGLNVQDNKLVGFRTGFAGGAIGGGVDANGNPTNFMTVEQVAANSYDLSGLVSLTTTPRKTRSNILQTPAVTTTHNKEAEIFVGETRPVISGTTTSTVNADTSSSTITQQEIGVRLRILPLIGSSGNVQLEIETEVEDILGNVTIDGNDQPIIGRRTTTSYVSARNGDIIVLGGLQRNSQSRNTSRLGPIPLIGDLLGARSRSKTRTELIFFLRPTVLTNTQLDNVEALRRIDSTPQSKDVRKVLETRPAAAPEGQPLPPPPEVEPSPEVRRPSGPSRKR
jgi:general secretion pathway protein D